MIWPVPSLCSSFLEHYCKIIFYLDFFLISWKIIMKAKFWSLPQSTTFKILKMCYYVHNLGNFLAIQEMFILQSILTSGKYTIEW